MLNPALSFVAVFLAIASGGLMLDVSGDWKSGAALTIALWSILAGIAAR